MKEEMKQCLNQLIGLELLNINVACQMLILHFDNIGIHCQTLARIKKNDDILFTTFDYFSWDEKDDSHNDEWYFLDKYSDDIIGGVVEKAELTKNNDVTLTFNNGIVIEMFVANGYFHYVKELEQWRILMNVDQENTYHYVVFSKHIEKQ